MNATVLGAPPARSRQEVIELIGLIGQFGAELERLRADEEAAIDEARSQAEAKAELINSARTEAQAKVEAWFRVHPEEAAAVPGAEHFLGDPVEAQLAAALLASARPLSQRQISILEALREGQVLRRPRKLRSYSLVWPDKPNEGSKLVSSNHVFDLQHRYLDAYDAFTGERLLGVSAFDDRKYVFRLKPGVVL